MFCKRSLVRLVGWKQLHCDCHVLSNLPPEYISATFKPNMQISKAKSTLLRCGTRWLGQAWLFFGCVRCIILVPFLNSSTTQGQTQYLTCDMTIWQWNSFTLENWFSSKEYISYKGRFLSCKYFRQRSDFSRYVFTLGWISKVCNELRAVNDSSERPFETRS